MQNGRKDASRFHTAGGGALDMLYRSPENAPHPNIFTEGQKVPNFDTTLLQSAFTLKITIKPDGICLFSPTNDPPQSPPCILLHRRISLYIGRRYKPPHWTSPNSRLPRYPINSTREGPQQTPRSKNRALASSGNTKLIATFLVYVILD